MSSINEIAKISLEKRQKMREDRKLAILGYLKLHPGQTVYSLHKYFGWPLASIHSILKELESDLHLSSKKTVKNNRARVEYYLQVVDDFIVDYFNSRTLLVPFNLRAAKNAQRKGYTIKIEMPDGKVRHVSPEEDIVEFIQNNNIVLDLDK